MWAFKDLSYNTKKFFLRSYMLWLGLTGGIGTGKSTVARFIREAGYPVVDADQTARDVLNKQINPLAHAEVISLFGEEFLDDTGSIDRKKLGAFVFSHPERLRELEGIIHPIVKRVVEREKKEAEDKNLPLAFYDVPLLFEKNLQEQFDGIVVVSTPLDRQMERVQKRDSLSREEINKRMANQLPIEDKIKRADYHIPNHAGLQDLQKETQKMLDFFLARKGGWNLRGIGFEFAVFGFVPIAKALVPCHF